MVYFNQRQRNLLAALAKNKNWIKGEELACTLYVSSRTIGNDVRYINQLHKEPIILSSHKGYKLIDTSFAQTDLNHDAHSLIPNTQNERIFYILKKMISHKEVIDIYDLANEIFVSTSTIEKDLKKIQDMLDRNTNICIKKKGNNICIQGIEKEKRALISEILFQETKNNFLDFQKYQTYFPNYSLDFICELVLSSTSNNGVFINDLSLVNLVVHIAITLDRIKDDNLVEDPDLDIERESPEYISAQQIANRLSEEYGISVPENEKIYLAYLIMGKKVINFNFENKEQIKKFVEPVYINLVKNIMNTLHHEYAIDLDDQEFLLNLAVHTKNAVSRIRNNYYAKNPLLSNLKLNYPFIFEIAVFITNEIYKQLDLDYPFNEDEIGYYALHVGAAYEKLNKSKRNSVNMAIIHSRYFKQASDFIKKIEELYNQSINMFHVFSFYDLKKIKSLNVDMILTTLPVEIELDIPVVQVSPFFNQNDLNKVKQFMEEYNERKQMVLLEGYTNKYFSSRFFFKDISFRDRFELITFVADKMEKEKKVPSTFVDSVIKREKISSTSFSSHFAIPHAIHMSAYETVIGTVILEKPLKWGAYYVNVIILLAIKEEERKDFMVLYENLIPILTDEAKVAELAKSRDFQHFKEMLLRK